MRVAAARERGIVPLLPAAAVALLALGGGAVAGYVPPPVGETAVVFAPWVSESEAFRAVLDSGGRFVGASRFDNIVIAYATDAGFGDRIRRAGAWLTVAAEGLCSPAPPRTETI
jgi:hypothetical protein